MEQELEALIKKALSKERDTKEQKEAKPVLTEEEMQGLYDDKDEDYEKSWQKTHNR